MTADPMLFPDAAPSLMGAALRAGGMILGLIALAVGWLLWQRRERRAERKMKIEDRLALHRGASVVLMRVDGQRLLVGVTADGIRLLRTLPEAGASDSRNFADLLQRAGDAAEAAS